MDTDDEKRRVSLRVEYKNTTKNAGDSRKIVYAKRCNPQLKRDLGTHTQTEPWELEQAVDPDGHW